MPDYEALDRYLRRRLAPMPRIAGSLAKALIAVPRLARADPGADPADVLLLHPHAGAAPRHAGLAAALARLGLAVREEILPDGRELVGERKLAAPAAGWDAVPRRWRPQAGYAAWIARRYAPRVLVTFMDDSVHTPFLRAEQAARGAALANVAHAIAWPNLDFSMCDVDWLLLWGERSLENLRAAPLRFGSCRALVAGSIYLAAAAKQERAAPARPPRLLWIGQDLGSAHRAALERDALAFARLAASRPEWQVTVRTHPLDRGELRALLASRLPAARWSEAAAPLADAASQCDVALASFSSGLVDAAAHAVPVVAFATSGLAAPIGLQDHALPVVANDAELARAVAAILDDYPRHSRAALALAREHLFGLDDATGRCAGALAALARGEDPAATGLRGESLEARDA